MICFLNFHSHCCRFFRPRREAEKRLVHWWISDKEIVKVSDYAIEFCTLSADSRWNKSTLIYAFLHVLAPQVKEQLITLEIIDKLNEVIAMTNKIDRQIQEREREKADCWQLPITQTTIPVPSFWETASSKPMQLGSTRLSTEERSRRFGEGLCLYCGGHRLATCCSRSSCQGSCQGDGTSEQNSL